MDSTEVLSNEQVYVHFHAEYCSYLAVELTVSKLKKLHQNKIPVPDIFLIKRNL